MPGLLASIVVHILLALLVFLMPQNGTRQNLEPSIFVELATLPKPPASEPRSTAKPAQQIVSPPENPESPTSPTETRFLSDKDTFTPKEQIRRGIDLQAGPAVSKSPGLTVPAPKPASAEQTQRDRGPDTKPQKAIKQFKLDQTTLTDKFGALPSSPDLNALVRDAVQGTESLLDHLGAGANPSAYQPFSRPFGSGARFLGAPGAPDYLPNLPDGDITLLNAKANQFAVFVRRVALQVFGQLRSSGWEFLRPSDIRAIETDSTVTAVLSPQGSLLKVSIESPSGSLRFDDVLKGAVQRGAKDPNPPPAAAREDGNIYFVFKSRSWTQLVSNPRTGAPTERRWLVLATGLE